MNITLTGFMGTGKTAVGKRLAKRLGWAFVDLDTLIEARAGKPIATIFAEHGERVFRRLEQRMIRRLTRARAQVIATGGGAFLDPSNRARLRVSGPVICLAAHPRTIWARVKPRLNARPLLAGAKDPLGRIQALLRRRAPAYAQADLTIDTTRLSVEEVVERLWAQLSPCLCRSWEYLLDHTQALATRYGGRYITMVENRIVASGATQLEAYQKARLSDAAGRGLRRERGPDGAGRRGLGVSARRSPRSAEPQEIGIYYVPLPEESLTALRQSA